MSTISSELMFYITTPIPYTNSQPHLGHLLEAVFNDTVARFYRTIDPETRLSMGLDQHGLKIYQKALELGQDPVTYAVTQGQVFKDLWTAFNISYDRFIETTSNEHKALVRLVWSDLQQKKLIYKKFYEGLYCVGDEAFVTEKDLVDGYCPNHPGQKPILMREENYFLRLSEFTEPILQFLQTADIQPDYVAKEFSNFVSEGLQDISISREKTKLPHGIEVPNDPNQVVYVWFDALLNYLTAVVDPELLKRLWKEPENLTLQAEVWQQIRAGMPISLMYLGKDIAKFHLVVWIGILSALGLPLPKRALIHGFINDAQGRKFSKSLGNGVFPEELVAKFGVDGTRFLLLFEINVRGDTNFDWTKMIASYNAHLADNLGNLVMRVTNLVDKTLAGMIDFQSVPSPFDFQEVKTKMEALEVKEALQVVLLGCSWGNEYLEQTQPWKLAKEGKLDEAKMVIARLCRLLLDLSQVLSIFLPQTAEKIRQILQHQPITKAGVLFPKVE